MPLVPSITIHTVDLQKIVDTLKELRAGYQQVQIVDNYNYWTIRDQEGMLLSTIPKVTAEELNQQV